MAPTGLFDYAWLMIAVPAVSAAILLLVGKAANSWGHLLGVVAPWVSFVIGVVLFVNLLGRPTASAPSMCRCSPGSRPAAGT